MATSDIISIGLPVLLQLIGLWLIGRKLGYNSGPFINFGLVVFGQFYLVKLQYERLVESGIYYVYTYAMAIALLLFYLCTSNHSMFVARISKNSTWRNSFVLKWTFFVFASIKAYQIYLTLQYGWGGARVIVFKDIIVLTIIHDLLQGPALLYIVMQNGIRKYLYFAFILALYIIAGSKSGSLVYVIEISFIHRICTGKRFANTLLLVIVALVGFFAATVLFYRNDDSLSSPNDFMRYRGDVYYLLFEREHRAEIFGLYDPKSYFFHHTLRMIGSKVYDGPVGTALFAVNNSSMLAETSGGPITPFYVTLDLLTQGNIFLVIFSSLFGVISALLFRIGFQMFCQSSSLANCIIGYWLMQSWYLVTDPTVFSYRMTPVFWLLVVPIIFFKMGFGSNRRLIVAGNRIA